MVKDATWTEMGNGAMRLSALLNGEPYQLTFAKNSDKGKKVREQGGTKMSEENIREYVQEYFVPRYQG